MPNSMTMPMIVTAITETWEQRMMKDVKMTIEVPVNIRKNNYGMVCVCPYTFNWIHKM